MYGFNTIVTSQKYYIYVIIKSQEDQFFDS